MSNDDLIESLRIVPPKHTCISEYESLMASAFGAAIERQRLHEYKMEGAYSVLLDNRVNMSYHSITFC